MEQQERKIEERLQALEAAERVVEERLRSSAIDGGSPPVVVEGPPNLGSVRAMLSAAGTLDAWLWEIGNAECGGIIEIVAFTFDLEPVYEALRRALMKGCILRMFVDAGRVETKAATRQQLLALRTGGAVIKLGEESGWERFTSGWHLEHRSMREWAMCTQRFVELSVA